ncbi:MAG: DUF5518 domain-containing protein [Methanobacterium sp. ERen5]|nr:MAG: DUF5518 domain-containing protein [Methanobacterium sp. ERen5]
MVNLNINWKFIVIGIVSAVLLYILLTNIGLKSIGFSAFFIGGIITGYLVQDNLHNTAVNGLLAGFLGGIIISLMALTLTILNPPSSGLNEGQLVEVLIVIFLYFVIVSGIISTIGSIITYLIKSKLNQNPINSE